MRVIYLHGFASSGNSSKSNWLREQFDACDIEFLSPDLPDKPADAIRFLDHELAAYKADDICLIGTSLGGFFSASYGARFGWPAVLINPLADVKDLTVSAMGENINYASGKTFVMDSEDAEALFEMSRSMRQSSAPSLLLLDKGDEILDYRKAVQRYGSYSTLHLFEGGSHRFEHLPDAMPGIMALLPVKR